MSASEKTAVDRLYEEANSIIQQLQKSSETSLQVSASDNLRKALLLAAASNFEHKVCSLLVDFVKERSSGSPLVEAFVRNKVISRQYHTLFSWEDNNANKFFSLFGKEFRDLMSQKTKASEELAESIKAFLELGNERNRMVHQDFASFPLDKTLDEIYHLYQKGLVFVEILPKELRDCDVVCRTDLSGQSGSDRRDK